MQRYIADDEVILNLAGLRWVEKKDTQYTISEQEYCLTWNYKGSEARHVYRDSVKRDALYDKVRKALISEE